MLEMNKVYYVNGEKLVLCNQDSEKTYFLCFQQAGDLFSFSVPTKNVLEKDEKIEFKEGTKYFGYSFLPHMAGFKNLKSIYDNAIKKDLEHKLK